MSVLFPSVPNVAGVPPVARAIDGSTPLATDDVEPLTADSADAATTDATPQWGIFDKDGTAAILAADSVVSLEYSKESSASTFPIEEGAFGSYNKVNAPYTARVRLTKSGSTVDRAQFLSDLEDLRDSTTLVSILMPETAYGNANILRFDIARSAQNGAQMLTVDVQLQEIRQSATATISTTKSPASTGVINNGSVQPQAASPAIVSAASAAK